MAFTFNPFTGKFDTITYVAKKIFGIPISNTLPTDKQALVYNNTSGEWEPQDQLKITTPTATTDNAIVTWDGVTGEAIQQATSNIPTISDDGIASFPDDGFADCERVGAGSSISGYSATTFGALSEATRESVSVGYLARCTTSRGQVSIGAKALASGFGATAISAGSDATGSQSFAMGINAQATNSFSLAWGPSSNVSGQYGIGMGQAVNVAHRSMAVGRNASSTADYQVVYGGLFNVYDAYYYGCNSTGLTSNRFTKAFEHFHGSVSGETDGIAQDVSWNSTQGTGAGKGGDLLFKVAPVGASGSSQNPLVTKFSITSEGEAVFSGAVRKPITTISANTTLDESHYTVLVDASTGDITIDLPTASSATGRLYNIKKITNPGSVTINPNGVEEIDGDLTAIITTLWDNLNIQSNGTGWFIL